DAEAEVGVAAAAVEVGVGPAADDAGEEHRQQAKDDAVGVLFHGPTFGLSGDGAGPVRGRRGVVPRPGWSLALDALLGRLLDGGVGLLFGLGGLAGGGLGGGAQGLLAAEVTQDAALGHFQTRVVVHLDDDLVLLLGDADDGAVDAGGEQHLVVLLDVADHHLPLALLALGGA